MNWRGAGAIALRGGGLLGKFLLLVWLAKYLDPSSVGLYGLLVAAINFSIYLIGFDFYTYTIREIATDDGISRKEKIKNHAYWLVISYFFSFPILFILFLTETLPASVIFWFYLILLLEHITAEFSRFFIMAEKQLLASVCLFLKTGMWPMICMLAMTLFASARSLNFVLASWLFGLVVALFVGCIGLQIGKVGFSRPGKPNWKWISRGLKVSIPILAATLSTRGIYTVDRYLLKWDADFSTVGVYVFYAGISSALLAFLEAGLFNFYYPALIKLWAQGKFEDYRKTFNRLAMLVVICSIGLSAACIFVMKIAAPYLSQAIYEFHIDVLYYCLASSAILGLSMVYYYDLYARKKDRFVLIAKGVGLLFFFGMYLAFTSAEPLNRVLWSVLAATLATLLISWIYSKVSRTSELRV